MKKLMILITVMFLFSVSLVSGESFVSVWDTSKTSTGSSNSTSVMLPLQATGSYDFIVDWGDGNSTYIGAYDTDLITHDYRTTGVFTINITGEIHGFRFDNRGDRNKILNVSHWGDLDLGNDGSYFYGCESLNILADDSLDLINTNNLGYAFYGANLTYANLSSWDVSSVTDMRYMFRDSQFNDNISSWDVSSVTDMRNMFYASPFNQDISNWDTSNVLYMNNMFRSSSFNQDISNWDVSSVTNMNSMFHNSPFNQDISSWDVSSVTDMQYMFYASPFNQNISNWDTSNVLYMDNMFRSSSFNQDISNWNIYNVTNMRYMFFRTPFNQNISNWDVSSVTDMREMFRESEFNQDISNWNVSSVTDMSDFITNDYNTTYYNHILGNWSLLQLQNGTTLDINSNYSCYYQSARDIMTNIFNWTINDLGLDETICSGCVPVLNQNWIISDNQTCDGKDVNIGEGNITITGSGKLFIVNNANVTTNNIALLSAGDKVFINTNSKLITR